jgi:hypothetical protein
VRIGRATEYCDATPIGAAVKSTSRGTCMRLLDDFEKAEAALLAETPEELRSHARVLDVQRALQGIKLAVRDVLERLGDESRI